jgi:hypothetical protein
VHPYRDVATRAEEPPRPDREELVLYGVLAAIGGIPVATALLSHDRFDLDGTLGLLMLIVGISGIVVQVLRALRIRSG